MATKQHREPLEDVELMAAVLEHQSVGVAIIRLPDLVYEYVNPAFQAFAPGKEMVGHRNSEVFPEMAFLAAEVLRSLTRVGDTWRAENVPNRISRDYGEPLEEVFGTFDVTLVKSGGRRRLLVTAIETTRLVRLASDYQRLHERELRHLAFAESMERINSVIHSSLDYDAIMQRSLEEGTKALGAKAGAVFIGLDGQSQARYIYGFSRRLLGRRFEADAFPFSSMMAERKTPIGVGPAEMGALMPPSLARLFRIRSLLAVPLVVKDKLVGGVGIVYREPHEFDSAELDFAATFGASVSAALENADLYHQQERVADTLQEALLVLPDQVEGVELAHAYRPAAEAMKVGGDFYDVFELEHDRVAITVGDISGKGLDAAALTSLVKNALRTKATEVMTSPVTAVRIANKVLVDASAPESFATVFFGILECSTGELSYCNAGHTTVLIRRAGGAVDTLGANSQLVGAFADAVFAGDSVSLAAGDVLLAYTDGVTEARSGTDFFGEERLIQLVEASPSRGPQALVDEVVGRVAEFAGQQLTDDVAVLALALAPGSPRRSDRHRAFA